MSAPSAVRRRFVRLGYLVLASAAAFSCEGSGGPGGVWDVPELDRQIIMPWLLCTDCIDGELDRVVKRGRRLVPYLTSAVVDGPTKADDSLAVMRARDAYERVLSYRARRGGAVTQAESLVVVTAQRDAFLLKYRLRAAEALARLDATRAASAVTSFCESSDELLSRNPQYRSSFQAIGPCP